MRQTLAAIQHAIQHFRSEAFLAHHETIHGHYNDGAGERYLSGKGTLEEAIEHVVAEIH